MRKLLAGVVAILAGRMLGRGAQFALFLVLTRTIGPAAFGAYGVLTTSILLASLLGSLGLRQASAHAIGQNEMSHGQGWSISIAALPVLSLISAGILWVAIAGDIRPFTGSWTLPILFAGVTGAMAVMVLQGVLLGLGRSNAFSISDSLYPLLLLGFVGIIYAFYGSIPVLWIFLAVAIAQLGAGLFAIGASSQGIGSLGFPSLSSCRNLLVKGGAFALNIFLVTLSMRVALYFIQNWISYEAVGQFFAGQRLSEMAVEISTSVGLVLFSDAVRSKDGASILRRNVNISSWIFWVFTIISIGICFLSDFAVNIVLGAKYAEAGTVLKITAFIVGPSSATKILYPSIAAQGKPLYGTLAILVSIIANIAGCYFLIPKFGLSGAAISLVVSQYIIFIGYIVVLQQKFGVPIKKSIFPSLRADYTPMQQG